MTSWGCATTQTMAPSRRCVTADGAGIGLGQIAADASRNGSSAGPRRWRPPAPSRPRARRAECGKPAAPPSSPRPPAAWPAAGRGARSARRTRPASPRTSRAARGSPPVTCARSACASSRARSSAMLTAPTARSSIIFLSPTMASSMVIETISPLPLAIQRTEPAAGLAHDGLAGQLLADARHLGLDPLGRLEQPLEVGDRHQVLISLSAVPKTSCALRMSGCWRASASRARRSAAAASFCCAHLRANRGPRARPVAGGPDDDGQLGRLAARRTTPRSRSRPPRASRPRRRRAVWAKESVSAPGQRSHIGVGQHRRPATCASSRRSASTRAPDLVGAGRRRGRDLGAGAAAVASAGAAAVASAGAAAVASAGAAGAAAFAGATGAAEAGADGAPQARGPAGAGVDVDAADPVAGAEPRRSEARRAPGARRAGAPRARRAAASRSPSGTSGSAAHRSIAAISYEQPRHRQPRRLVDGARPAVEQNRDQPGAGPLREPLDLVDLLGRRVD